MNTSPVLNLFQSAQGNAPLGKLFGSFSVSKKTTPTNILSTLRSSPDVLTIGERGVTSRPYKPAQSSGISRSASNNSISTSALEQEKSLSQTHETLEITTEGRFDTNTLIKASKTALNVLTIAHYMGDTLSHTITKTRTYEPGKGWIEHDTVEFTPEGQAVYDAFRKNPSGRLPFQWTHKATVTMGGEVVFQEEGRFLCVWNSEREVWGILRPIPKPCMDSEAVWDDKNQKWMTLREMMSSSTQSESAYKA